MKKIKFLISIIYFFLIILISLITLFYLVKTIKDGVNIYFSNENENNAVERFNQKINISDLNEKLDFIIKIKALEK
jgi:uncharacterized protein YxeA